MVPDALEPRYKQPMQQVGIVDLGSKTARLVVYEYEPGKGFRMRDEIREPIRLGEGLARGGRLASAAIDRAEAVLRLYSDFARAIGLETLEILATSALRDAENREEFLDQVAPLGLDVQLLSGEDEARLGVLAVANSFDLEDAWVMDLGGGSAQLSRMRKRLPEHCRSVPLGNVRLTETFLDDDPPTPEQVSRLEDAVAEQVGDLVEAMAEDGLPLIAMGGTVRNLAKAVMKREDYRFQVLHHYFLPRAPLEELVGRLVSIRAQERARVRGIHPDRGDVILAGALVYRWILRHAGRDGLWIAGQGLREGAFYRHFLPEPHLLSDVRKFSVKNLFRRYPQPKPHTRRVRQLARDLFDDLQPLHGFGDEERELLDAAARLHDIGTAVSYYNHHKHGAYLVESAPVPGFDHRQQMLLSLAVRHYRKGTPKLGSYKKLLGDGDLERLNTLCACLRLAEDFERSRAGRVQGFEAQINKKTVVLQVQAEEAPLVELAEAGKHGPLFRRAFGRKLKLQSVVKTGAGR